MSYKSNRKWSDYFIPRIKEILCSRDVLIHTDLPIEAVAQVGTKKEDCSFGIDLKIKVAIETEIKMSARVLNVDYKNPFYNNMTVRATTRHAGWDPSLQNWKPTGIKTEIQKLLFDEDIKYYSFFFAPRNYLEKYYLIDCDLLRKTKFLKPPFEDPVGYQENHDGITAFIKIPFPVLKDKKCILWEDKYPNPNQYTLNEMF